MTDIEGSYNTDLLGLLQSARKHGAKAYTGIGKLSEIVNAVGDYGHLPSLIERVREDFNDFKWKIQTPDGPVSQTIDKLVNIWLLQQDLLLGNKFDDFIVDHESFFQLDESYKIEDSLINLFTLSSGLEEIYAVYVGEIDNVSTDTVILY